MFQIDQFSDLCKKQLIWYSNFFLKNIQSNYLCFNLYNTKYITLNKSHTPR